MSFKDHFSQLAARYAQFRPSYPASLFEYLAGLCPQRRLVWDCACGNGQASLGLADHFDSVVATDASAQQVASATPNSKITYRVARAEDSGLESGTVDLVTAAQALHWFDLNTFYAEVRRVLRPSGVLVVWAYGALHVAGNVDGLMQEFYSGTVGPYWPPERRFVEDGYRSLAFPFAELAPPPFNMELTWDRGRVLGYLRTWSATARYVDANGVDPVVALEEKIAPFWPDAASARKVCWPLALRVGRMP